MVNKCFWTPCASRWRINLECKVKFFIAVQFLHLSVLVRQQQSTTKHPFVYVSGMQSNLFKCTKPGLSEIQTQSEKICPPFLWVHVSSSHQCLHQSEVPVSRCSHWWIRALSKVASPRRLSTHLAKWMTIGATHPRGKKQTKKTPTKLVNAVLHSLAKLPPWCFAGECEPANQTTATDTNHL